VLILDGMAVPTVEIHIEAGVAQCSRLALLDGLAPDEVLDVRMVGIEDDHLGGPPGLTTRIVGDDVVNQVLVDVLHR